MFTCTILAMSIKHRSRKRFGSASLSRAKKDRYDKKNAKKNKKKKIRQRKRG